MKTAISLAIGLLLASMLISAPRARAAEVTPAQASSATDEKISTTVKAAVEAPDRPTEDKKLDVGRRPAQVLAFFDIQRGMKVADLVAGGGYTTELLSRIVGPNGKVYSQNGSFPPRLTRVEKQWHERLKKPALANVVAVNDLRPVKTGSLDAVIMNLNYHDLIWMGVDRDQLNAEVFRVLRPGGTYGIVDHSAQAGSGIRDVKTLHRIDESFLTKEVEKAGFKLAATSPVLRHPEDDRTWFVFKHRGETDRFVLKFVKP